MKNLFLVALLWVPVSPVFSQDDYSPGPVSWKYPNIPEGKVTKHSWRSNIYPNTVRDYYVYVPAQYNPAEPAALMIFQDGHAYVNEEGDFRVPVVFDNVISQEKMPVTIGLFIDPGHDSNAPAPENPWRATNRSVEYDDVSATYGRFLLEEMIPELKKTYNISDDPKMRAICGISSGGICAFTVAWFYPDQFHKVLSHIGSFVNIRGGHNYPSMIRKNDRKDIKIFLQDGSHDLNNEHGNWWLANQQMGSALQYKGYEYLFVEGTGAHNGKHGGAILPQSLVWLWSDRVSKTIPFGVYPLSPQVGDVMMKGQTVALAEAEMSKVDFSKTENISLQDMQNEQIVIVVEGKVNFSLGSKSRVVGPGSVLVLMQGDKGSVSKVSGDATCYTMRYRSKHPADVRRGRKSGGSAIVDFEELDFREHGKGGVRNYFNRSTAMCPYYEMHMTTLNGGLKSHEPHTHKAAEWIFMIEGETEMEIGNKVFSGKKGDFYFADSNTPHAIRNTGETPCRYIAFQLE